MNLEIKIYHSFDKSLEIIWRDFEKESAKNTFWRVYKINERASRAYRLSASLWR